MQKCVWSPCLKKSITALSSLARVRVQANYYQKWIFWWCSTDYLWFLSPIWVCEKCQSIRKIFLKGMIYPRSLLRCWGSASAPWSRSCRTERPINRRILAMISGRSPRGWVRLAFCSFSVLFPELILRVIFADGFQHNRWDFSQCGFWWGSLCDCLSLRIRLLQPLPCNPQEIPLTSHWAVRNCPGRETPELKQRKNLIIFVVFNRLCVFSSIQFFFLVIIVNFTNKYVSLIGLP